MIVNTYTVSYGVLSGCSLAMAAGAGGVGAKAGLAWGKAQSPEQAYGLEKLSYLAMTLATLALYIRLFLVPYWFWTLQSLVPCIPGAMCLAGVHMANAPVSFISSVMKLVVPFGYGFWLLLNRIDRSIESQPFSRLKLLLLAPLGLVMAAEAAIDIAYLRGLRPRPVSCCTSLFDMPGEGVPELVASSNWVWTAAFFVLAVLLASLLLISKAGDARRPFLQSATLVVSLATPVVFFLSLHTKASPLLLDAPYHHCVFCLWQARPVAVAFTALVLAGTWLAFSDSAVRLVGRGDARSAAAGMLRRASSWAVVCVLSGAAMLGASIAWQLAKGN